MTQLRGQLRLHGTLSRIPWRTTGCPCGRQLLGVLILLSWLSGPLMAQNRQARTLPDADYFASFGDYFRGEYTRAAKNFRSAARGGYTGVNGPWVDSVCYHAMIGECFFQVGDTGSALEQYNTALRVFVANGNWLASTEFPANVQMAANTNQARINWGTTRRDTAIGNFPDSIPVMIGNLQGIDQRGIVQQAQLRPANVGEIMRCLSIALRRRIEILGPVAGYDPVTRQAVDALESVGVAGNHWARAWVDIPLALGMVAEGDIERAAGILQSSIQTAGGLDHPLSAIAMLELGKLYFRAESFAEAEALFYEATLSSAVYGQQDILEEAFQWGTRTHLVQKTGGVYGPLPNALAWAQRDGSRQLVASLSMQLADCYLAMGDTAKASGLLTQAQRAMQRNDIGRSPLGAQLAYLSAQASFQSGNVAGGINDLSNAMALQQIHSRWLLHISLTDKFIVSGAIPERTAAEMYEQMLRDPQPADWLVSPMECLSVLLLPHPVPFEHWFDLAVGQRDAEKAVEISDRIRRQRFFNTLPLGGRVMALRWVLEAPREALTPEAEQQRQDFLLQHPRYTELSARAQTLIDSLRTIPLVPDPSSKERADQKKMLEELGQISSAQEALLSEAALRREPAELAFPPIRSVAQIREQLRDGQMIVAYFATSKAVYQFRLTKEEYVGQRLDNSASIRGDLAKLLRAIGNVDRNQAIDEDVLLDESWKESARDLAEVILPNMDEDQWARVDELIVVPDGVLWYLPFELLQVGPEENSMALIETLNIRYLPTVSLAVPDSRQNQPTGTLAVATDRLYPRDEPIVADEAFAMIQEDSPAAIQLKTILPGPSSLLTPLIDRLMVLDDIEDQRGSVYGVVPIPLDQDKPGYDLASWMALPFGGIEQIALPGFHTAAENGMRQRDVNGNEVFLAVCGMMASGTRTALVSRWRPGGQSSYELMREFLRELPQESAMEAWRRSLDLSWRGDIVVELEPRLKVSAPDTKLDPKHPFFWAGYMLIDTGVQPIK